MTVVPKKQTTDSLPSGQHNPPVAASARDADRAPLHAGLLAGLSDLFTRRRYRRGSVQLPSAGVSPERE